MINSAVPVANTSWPTRRVWQWNDYEPTHASRIDIHQERRFGTLEAVMRITVRDTSRATSGSIQMPKNESVAMAFAILRAAGVTENSPALTVQEQELLAAIS